MNDRETTVARHTPGPWEYFDAKEQDGTPTIGIRGDAQFIATMDTVAVGSEPFRLPPNAEANARLIAAAPAMLAALRALIFDNNNWIYQLAEDANDGDDSANVTYEAVRAARAAIDAAEGGAA